MHRLSTYNQTIKVPYTDRDKRLIDIISKRNNAEWFSLGNPKIFILKFELKDSYYIMLENNAQKFVIFNYKGS